MLASTYSLHFCLLDNPSWTEYCFLNWWKRSSANCCSGSSSSSVWNDHRFCEHMHATQTNSFNNLVWCVGNRSSIGKVLGWKCTTSLFRWFNTYWSIFPTLGNLGFSFFLLLLIIFSSKLKFDSPVQQNQQLKQAKQNTVEPTRLPGSYKETLNHLITFLVYRKIRPFIDAVVDKLFKVSWIPTWFSHQLRAL